MQVNSIVVHSRVVHSLFCIPSCKYSTSYFHCKDNSGLFLVFCITNNNGLGVTALIFGYLCAIVSLGQWSPTFLATVTGFLGDNFSMGQGGREWFQEDSSALHSSSRPAGRRIPGRPGPVLICGRGWGPCPRTYLRNKICSAYKL